MNAHCAPGGREVAPPLQESGGDPMTDLEMLMATMDAFNVEYTLIQDEAGATVEVAGGSRGTHGWSGVAITYNFGPRIVEGEAEKFLFMGMVRE